MFASTIALFHSHLSSHLKQLYRNIALCIVCIFSLLFCTFSFVAYAKYGDPFVLVYRTRYTQFVVTFFAMIIGIFISQNSFVTGFTEISKSIKHHSLLHSISMISAILISVSAYFLAYILLFVTFLSVYIPVDSAVLIHCINYMILYVYIPCCTLSIVGAAISVQIESYSKYAVALLVWLFLTPIVCLVGEYIFSFLKIKGDLVKYMLHILNQGDMIFTDNPSSYTLHTDWARYFVRIAFLIVSLGYLCIALLIKNKPAKLRSAMGASLAVAILAVTLFTENPTTMRYYTKYILNTPAYAHSEDAEYYSKISRPDLNPEFDLSQALPDFTDAISLQPVSSDISIALAELGARYVCNNTYEIMNPSDVQTFTLYRGFDVIDVQVNGSSVEYKRSGDYLNVFIPDGAASGESIDLCFTYEGLSSAAFPATKNLVFLPSTYAYLPQVGYLKPPATSDDGMGGYETLMLFSASRNACNVEYTLSVDTENPVYSNLHRDDDGVWRGISDSGLTIVSSPLLKRTEYDQYTLYGPDLSFSRLKEITALYQHFEDTQTSFLEFVDAIELLPSGSTNDIVLLPTSPGPYGISVFYYLNNFIGVYQGTYSELDLVLNNCRYLSASEDDVYLEKYYYQLVKNWLNELPSIGAAMATHSFNNYVLDVIVSAYQAYTLDILSANKRFIDFEGSPLYYYYLSEGYNMQLYQETSLKLKELFISDNIEAIRSFAAGWFDACMNYAELDMEYINTLIDDAMNKEGV